MKILKKVGIILMMTILLLSSGLIGSNDSKAVITTYSIRKADLYSKGEFVEFKYKGALIGVQFVVYKQGEIEYPAYCLNKYIEGVTEEYGYSVKVDKVVADAKIWRAVTNGYPFKTPAELGCQTSMEAFAATKMAVYDAMYNYDWADFEAISDAGQRAIKAAEKISKIARSSNETKISSILEIVPDNPEWKVDNIDKKCVSKTYTVKANVENSKYWTQLTKNGLDVKLVDENNVEKNEFKGNEKFKLLMPITELGKDGKIRFSIRGEMKTRPILYGSSQSENLQSYALVAGDYEYETILCEENFYKNKTQIEIIKLDKENQSRLEGAKFNIYNENNELIYTDVTTNLNGKVLLEGVMYGKYYIEEVKAPDGYTKNDELIEINVEHNQKFTVKIENWKKPKDEEKKVDDNEVVVEGKKEINLPKTGY